MHSEISILCRTTVTVIGVKNIFKYLGISSILYFDKAYNTSDRYATMDNCLNSSNEMNVKSTVKLVLQKLATITEKEFRPNNESLLKIFFNEIYNDSNNGIKGTIFGTQMGKPIKQWKRYLRNLFS